MPFIQVGIPDGSRFKHIPSDRNFILNRCSCYESLILTLHDLNAPESKSEAGYLKAAAEFDRCLNLGPRINESHFTVTFIRTEYDYRNISLGTMLLFITAREVQANGGVYLYLQYPVSISLGFYSQFGFHPAPENVEKRHFRALEQIWKTRRAKGVYDLSYPEIPFQDKLIMKSNFSLWRGAINPVLELLTKKLEAVYSFE